MEKLSLSEVVAWIESRGALSAIRFEPTVYNKFTTGAELPKEASAILRRIQAANKCSIHTAAMIYSTSWGKFQLMGFNVYADADFSMPIGEFLASQTAQGSRLVSFLKRNGLADYTPQQLAVDQSARSHFAMKYNGAIGYANNIVAALKYFGMEAK